MPAPCLAYLAQARPVAAGVLLGGLLTNRSEGQHIISYSVSELKMKRSYWPCCASYDPEAGRSACATFFGCFSIRIRGSQGGLLGWLAHDRHFEDMYFVCEQRKMRCGDISYVYLHDA